MSRRRLWTDAESRLLRRRYRADGPAALAKRLRRSVRSVYQQAAKLGLSEPTPRWSADDEAVLRAMNADGFSDIDVAARLGRDRHMVGRHRKRLGLPGHAYGERTKGKIRDGVRRQLDRLGVASMDQLRVDSWRRKAIAAGWPTTVNGRAVCRRHFQVLELLWAHGPQTRESIAAAIGATVHANQRKTLASNGKGGSYLAELMRAGLVVALGRVVTGKGKGRSVQLYALDLSVQKGTYDAG